MAKIIPKPPNAVKGSATAISGWGFILLIQSAALSRMRACRFIDLEWSSCDISTAADLLFSAVCAHRRLRTESSPRSPRRLRASRFRRLGTPTAHRIASQREPHRGSSFTCPRRLPVLRRHSPVWNFLIMWQSLGRRGVEDRTVAASATGAGKKRSVTMPVAEAATVRLCAVCQHVIPDFAALSIF